MATAEEIEQALPKLPPAELEAFRQWFVDFDASAWDRKLENDIAAGRLDAFAEEALRDLHAGRCTDL